jgi:hypothetical protein
MSKRTATPGKAQTPNPAADIVPVPLRIAAEAVAKESFRVAFSTLWDTTLRIAPKLNMEQFVDLYVRAMQKQMKHDAGQWGYSA